MDIDFLCFGGLIFLVAERLEEAPARLVSVLAVNQVQVVVCGCDGFFNVGYFLCLLRVRLAIPTGG